jgi:hypothetical protein
MVVFFVCCFFFFFFFFLFSFFLCFFLCLHFDSLDMVRDLESSYWCFPVIKYLSPHVAFHSFTLCMNYSLLFPSMTRLRGFCWLFIVVCFCGDIALLLALLNVILELIILLIR